MPSTTRQLPISRPVSALPQFPESQHPPLQIPKGQSEGSILLEVPSLYRGNFQTTRAHRCSVGSERQIPLHHFQPPLLRFCCPKGTFCTEFPGCVSRGPKPLENLINYALSTFQTSQIPTKGYPRGGPAGRHVRGGRVRDDLVGLEHWCALLHTKSCTPPSQCILKRLTCLSSLVSAAWARGVLVAAKVSPSLVNGA